MAHRDRKDWIKEQFRIHGLHKPNHHTWTQAEDQLQRYLNAKPSNPAPPVDIAAVLKSQQEWVTNTPPRGSKEDTEATERYRQRQAEQEAAAGGPHTTPKTTGSQQRSQPYPEQAAPGGSSSDLEGQRRQPGGAAASSSSRGQLGQEQNPLGAQTHHHTQATGQPAQPQPQRTARQAEPEHSRTAPGHTPHTQARPSTANASSQAKPGRAGDTRSSGNSTHEPASSSWEALPNRPPPPPPPLRPWTFPPGHTTARGSPSQRTRGARPSEVPAATLPHHGAHAHYVATHFTRGTHYGHSVPEHARWYLVGGFGPPNGALASLPALPRRGDSGGIQTKPP